MSPDKVKATLEKIFGVSFRYIFANNSHVLTKYGAPHVWLQWGDSDTGFTLTIYPTEQSKAIYATPIGTTEPLASVINNLERYGMKVVGYEQTRLF